MTTEEKSKRGFASMTPERRRELASMGGKAAWEPGRPKPPHSWTSEEARLYGAKGGTISRIKPKNSIVTTVKEQ